MNTILAALKEILADETKVKQSKKFQLQQHNVKQWIEKNGAKLRDDFFKAIEKEADILLAKKLKTIGHDITACAFEFANSVKNLHTHIHPAIVKEYTDLGLQISPENIPINIITSWKLEHQLERYLKNEGFRVTKKVPPQLAAKQHYGDYSDNAWFKWYLEWTKLPFYYDMDIDWVKAYDILQLMLFHRWMVDFIEQADPVIPEDVVKNLEREYGEGVNPSQRAHDLHDEKKRYYRDELSSIFGCDMDSGLADYNEVYQPYKEEIETWLKKVVNEKNIGKEPEKKLKLTDPRNL